MDASALHVFSGDENLVTPLPVRGVGWVLRWAVTLAILAASGAILLGFGYQIAAERTLARAAAAGLREAALPRATHESIAAVVRRRLAETLALDRATRVQLANSNGETSIGLAVPVSAVLPRWMSVVTGSELGEIRVRSSQPTS
jgi:hypothetical protein